MSGLDDAKRRLGNVFDSDAHGLTVVMRSKTVNRLDLIAWMMDDFARDYDPHDGFAALYVCDQLEQIQLVRRRLSELRYRRTGTDVDDLELIGQTPQLPPRLPAFTYISDVALDRVSDHFTAGSLDLVIIDERRNGELAPHYEFVKRVGPDLTIFITKQAPPEFSPWRRLGKTMYVDGISRQGKSPSHGRSR